MSATDRAPTTEPAAPTSHRSILALAVPATAALASDPLLSLVDTALVGRLGAVSLAALGIDAALFTTIFWAFNFLTYGTTAAVARLRGAARPEEAAAYVVQALWLALGLGAVSMAALLLFAPVLVALMGATGAVTDPAVAYLRVRALAAIPVLVVAVGHGAFRGLHDTRTPLWVVAVANGANALLSWVLIYPTGLGVVGAAWGTVVAQTGAAAALVVLGRRSIHPPDLAIRPAQMRSLVTVSRDLFLRTAALLSGLLVTTAVAARMGVVTVAAHQIARELWTMLALVLDGFAIAGQALVASALGAGMAERARADARRLVGWGAAAGTMAGAAYLALAGPLPRLFTSDAAVLAAVATVWPIVALLQPVGGVVFVLDGVLMGAEDYRYLWWSTAAAALLALAPLAVLALARGWGLPGIWVAMCALMAVRLATTAGRLASGRWAAQPG